MPCNGKRGVGCHGCILEKAREEMMFLYHALNQFITEPRINSDKIMQQAVSIKRRIADLIVTDYKEDQDGYSKSAQQD